MGWCSGTNVFDTVVEELLRKKKLDKVEIIAILINALRDNDWDCEDDSAYWDKPEVKKAFRKLDGK